MAINIRMFYNDRKIEYETIFFNGGEVHPRITNFAGNLADHVRIEARLLSSDEIMLLVLLVDALRETGYTGGLHLNILYMPYARQDRVCVKGEAFGLRCACKIINSLEFTSVTVLDPHSDVTPALLNNCKIIDQVKLIGAWNNVQTGLNARLLDENILFVSPDAGANKKTLKIAQYFSKYKFIRADKLRNLATGDIIETIVYADEDEIRGRDVVIVDDICDGGRTFVELAKVLKSKGANKVILVVTYGIFSNGVFYLNAQGIDEIWCHVDCRKHVDRGFTAPYLHLNPNYDDA